MKSHVSVIQWAHHGEVIQGRFKAADGRYHVALLTLPWKERHSTVSLEHDASLAKIVAPKGRTKAQAAAELAKSYLGLSDLGAVMTISSNIPDGVGMGSSSADTIAAIRAVAKLADAAIPDEVVARLAVHAEGASDAIMFDREVLFASRDGIVLETFSAALPHFAVLGFCNGAPLNTLATPLPSYDEEELQTFKILRASLRRALNEGNARMVARIATQSAEVNERYFPKPRFAHIRRLAEKHGALGVQVAHTGSVMGLLFDPRDAQSDQRIKATIADLQRIGIVDTWVFSTREPQEQAA